MKKLHTGLPSALLRLFARLLKMLLLLALMGPFASPKPAQAASINFLENTLNVDAIDTFTFRMRANTDVKIRNVSILVGTEGSPCYPYEESLVVPHAPGKNVDVVKEWYLRDSAVGPGVVFWWEWVLVDESGAKHHSERQTQLILPPEIEWQEFVNDSIRMFYAVGEQDFGPSFFEHASGILEKELQEFGLEEAPQVRFVIFSSQEMYHQAADYLPIWAAGNADVANNLIKFGVTDGSDGNWERSAITHELLHLVLFWRLDRCEDNAIPTWFGEGLANHAEGGLSMQHRWMIESAIADETLPKLYNLAGSFPEDSGEAEMAYAVSHAAVEYLYVEHGSESIQRILDSVRDGGTFQNALLEETGLTEAWLDRAWQEGFSSHPQTTGIDQKVGWMVLLSVLMFSLAGFGLLCGAGGVVILLWLWLARKGPGATPG